MTKSNAQSFEDALKNLEKIVRMLETGDVPLEQALDIFQEGVGLLKFCNEKLDSAEKKIELLLEGPDGQPVLVETEDF